MAEALLTNLTSVLSITDNIGTVGQAYPLLPVGNVIIGEVGTTESITAANDVEVQNAIDVKFVGSVFVVVSPREDVTTASYEVHDDTNALIFIAVVAVARYYPTDVATVANDFAVDILIYDAVGATPYAPQQSIPDLTNPLVTFSVRQTGFAVLGQASVDLYRANNAISRFVMYLTGVNTVNTESLAPATPVLQGAKCPPPPPANQGRLTISFVTDAYSGSLNEIYATITDNKRYPHGYPRKLVARNRGAHVTKRTDGLYDTFFSFTPAVVTTLKGSGDYDLQRVEQLYAASTLTITLLEFYNNVMSYASLKYVLAGLITGCYDIKWLYGMNNAKFFRLLADSDFASLITNFQPYVGYEEYFLWSPAV